MPKLKLLGLVMPLIVVAGCPMEPEFNLTATPGDQLFPIYLDDSGSVGGRITGGTISWYEDGRFHQKPWVPVHLNGRLSAGAYPAGRYTVTVFYEGRGGRQSATFEVTLGPRNGGTQVDIGGDSRGTGGTSVHTGQPNGLIQAAGDGSILIIIYGGQNTFDLGDGDNNGDINPPPPAPEEPNQPPAGCPTKTDLGKTKLAYLDPASWPYIQPPGGVGYRLATLWLEVNGEDAWLQGRRCGEWRAVYLKYEAGSMTGLERDQMALDLSQGTKVTGDMLPVPFGGFELRWTIKYRNSATNEEVEVSGSRTFQ